MQTDPPVNMRRKRRILAGRGEGASVVSVAPSPTLLVPEEVPLMLTPAVPSAARQPYIPKWLRPDPFTQPTPKGGSKGAAHALPPPLPEWVKEHLHEMRSSTERYQVALAGLLAGELHEQMCVGLMRVKEAGLEQRAVAADKRKEAEGQATKQSALALFSGGDKDWCCTPRGYTPEERAAATKIQLAWRAHRRRKLFASARELVGSPSVWVALIKEAKKAAAQMLRNSIKRRTGFGTAVGRGLSGPTSGRTKAEAESEAAGATTSGRAEGHLRSGISLKSQKSAGQRVAREEGGSGDGNDEGEAGDGAAGTAGKARRKGRRKRGGAAGDAGAEDGEGGPDEDDSDDGEWTGPGHVRWGDDDKLEIDPAYVARRYQYPGGAASAAAAAAAGVTLPSPAPPPLPASGAASGAASRAGDDVDGVDSCIQSFGHTSVSSLADIRLRNIERTGSRTPSRMGSIVGIKSLDSRVSRAPSESGTGMTSSRWHESVAEGDECEEWEDEEGSVGGSGRGPRLRALRALHPSRRHSRRTMEAQQRQLVDSWMDHHGFPPPPSALEALRHLMTIAACDEEEEEAQGPESGDDGEMGWLGDGWGEQEEGDGEGGEPGALAQKRSDPLPLQLRVRVGREAEEGAGSQTAPCSPSGSSVRGRRMREAMAASMVGGERLRAGSASAGDPTVPANGAFSFRMRAGSGDGKQGHALAWGPNAKGGAAGLGSAAAAGTVPLPTVFGSAGYVIGRGVPGGSPRAAAAAAAAAAAQASTAAAARGDARQSGTASPLRGSVSASGSGGGAGRAQHQQHLPSHLGPAVSSSGAEARALPGQQGRQPQQRAVSTLQNSSSTDSGALQQGTHSQGVDSQRSAVLSPEGSAQTQHSMLGPGGVDLATKGLRMSTHLMGVCSSATASVTGERSELPDSPSVGSVSLQQQQHRRPSGGGVGGGTEGSGCDTPSSSATGATGVVHRGVLPADAEIKLRMALSRTLKDCAAPAMVPVFAAGSGAVTGALEPEPVFSAVDAEFDAWQRQQVEQDGGGGRFAGAGGSVAADAVAAAVGAALGGGCELLLGRVPFECEEEEDEQLKAHAHVYARAHGLPYRTALSELIKRRAAKGRARRFSALVGDPFSTLHASPMVGGDCAGGVGPTGMGCGIQERASVGLERVESWLVNALENAALGEESVAGWSPASTAGTWPGSGRGGYPAGDVRPGTADAVALRDRDWGRLGGRTSNEGADVRPNTAPGPAAALAPAPPPPPTARLLANGALADALTPPPPRAAAMQEVFVAPPGSSPPSASAASPHARAHRSNAPAASASARSEPGWSPKVLPDGTQILADGRRLLPDGTTMLLDGTRVLRGGVRLMPPLADAVVRSLPDGTKVLSDRTKLLRDGARVLADGVTRVASPCPAAFEGIRTTLWIRALELPGYPWEAVAQQFPRPQALMPPGSPPVTAFGAAAAFPQQQPSQRGGYAPGGPRAPRREPNPFAAVPSALQGLKQAATRNLHLLGGQQHHAPPSPPPHGLLQSRNSAPLRPFSPPGNSGGGGRAQQLHAGSSFSGIGGAGSLPLPLLSQPQQQQQYHSRAQSPLPACSLSPRGSMGLPPRGS